MAEITRVLDRGAPIQGPEWSALILAIAQGRKEVVPLLLDRGANINIVGGIYGTALATAVYQGAEDTVSLLLDRGADVNLADGEFGTALAVAVLAAAKGRGSVDTVSLLLDRGANVNMVSGICGTALAMAAYMGPTETVWLLLDRGADVNMVGGKYGTALATAAASPTYNATISLLLDQGAGVNMVGGKYGTALATAAVKRNEAAVSLLLDRGADADIVGAEYGTALAVAAFVGAKNTVSLLLDRGVDANIMGGKYGTALAAAISKQKWEIMSLLIERGADINLVIGSCGTVLGQAIYEGSQEITSRLLKHGADLTYVGGSYSTSSGVYPSALDVADSEGSKASYHLCMMLKTAIRRRNGHATNANLADNAISRPPFPMPFTRPSALCVTHHTGTLPSAKTLEFCASGNITPEQADVPCQVGEALWRSLVTLVGLHEDMTQAKNQWIQNDVRYFVACNYDFGFAYAAARVAWAHFNEPSVDCSVISVHRGRWHKHARTLDEARSKAIEIDLQTQQELIVSPYSIMPRRLWDLKSNRVVNFRMLHAAQTTIKTKPIFWAVTHSWTRDMSPIWTAINQYQWPVPLPKDITLESLRSELLALGAEYVWIDVVCLRQKSEVEHLEKLRVEEWKLDIPTIGNVYRTAANIVRYFNGLGVRFSNQDWDGPRHWLQRAWTLQEIADENTTINGGILQGDEDQIFLNSSGEVLGKDKVRKVIKLRSALRPVLQLAAQVDGPYGCELYELAREMSRRHATQPVDKLAGLFYLLRTTKLPCYDANKTGEDIWRQCFYLLPPEQKAQILFNFPHRASEEQWFPTWAQVLDWPVRDPEYDHTRSWIESGLIKTIREEVTVPLFISNIRTISDTTLIKTNHPGEYKIKINNLTFGFYQPYLSQKPINMEGHPVFTLATAHLGQAHNWLVCRAVEKYQWAGADADLGVTEFKVLKKVGVLRTDAISELLVRGLLQSVDCLFI